MNFKKALNQSFSASEFEHQIFQRTLVKPNKLQSLMRQWNSLKHYRVRQMAQRAWNLARTRLGWDWAGYPEPLRPLPLDPTVLGGLAGLFEQRCGFVDWGTSSRNHQAALAKGELQLLNEPRNVGFPVQWSLDQQPDVAHLWKFQLHYHEFLLALALQEPGNRDQQQFVVEILQDWISNHPSAKRRFLLNAWHPYCISRRIPVWLMLLGHWDRKGWLFAKNEIFDSLLEQAHFLSQRLEWDLRGNHLLENFRALLQVDCVVPEWQSKEKRSQRLKQFVAELDSQLLASGEHFERSPMYHCQVLGNLLELAILSSHNYPALADVCRSRAKPMWSFLKELLHPDGEIPLFSDSCFGEAPPVGYLRLISERICDSAEPHSPNPRISEDYWVYRDSASFVVWDRGAVAADDLPAHAHCDLLNFEVSLDGQRLIVDSGLYNYQADSMRQYVRSSPAHNVVTVEGSDHCEIWSRFRMGRRGRVSRKRAGISDSFSWATASHDAYRSQGVSRIDRLMAVHQDGVLVCLDRLVERDESKAMLTLIHGFVHFHPQVTVQVESENAWIISCGTQRYYWTTWGTDSVQLGQSWYCPEFGIRQSRPVLKCTPNRPLFGWVLSRMRLSFQIVSKKAEDSPEFEVVAEDGLKRLCVSWS